MRDERVRFYLDTIFDDDGHTVAQVMERPRPFAPAVCVEKFSHEWRACRCMDRLEKEAFQRGERVVYNPGEDMRTWA